MQMTNESTQFPPVYARSIQVSPSLSLSHSVPLGQSHLHRFVYHRESVAPPTVSFSKFCFMPYPDTLGLSESSHPLTYHLLFAKVMCLSYSGLYLSLTSGRGATPGTTGRTFFADFLRLFQMLLSPILHLSSSSWTPFTSLLCLFLRDYGWFSDADFGKETSTPS